MGNGNLVYCALCQTKWDRRGRHSCRHFKRRHSGQEVQLLREPPLHERDYLLSEGSDDTEDERVTELKINMYMH